MQNFMIAKQRLPQNLPILQPTIDKFEPDKIPEKIPNKPIKEQEKIIHTDINPTKINTAKTYEKSNENIEDPQPKKYKVYTYKGIKFVLRGEICYIEDKLQFNGYTFGDKEDILFIKVGGIWHVFPETMQFQLACQSYAKWHADKNKKIEAQPKKTQNLFETIKPIGEYRHKTLTSDIREVKEVPSESTFNNKYWIAAGVAVLLLYLGANSNKNTDIKNVDVKPVKVKKNNVIEKAKQILEEQ